MRGLVMGLALGFCASGAHAEACAPPSLTRIVTREVTPQLAPTHFARLPKTLYRLGAGKARLEEAPDKVQGVQVLAVIAEPDIWFADLAQKTGRHMVDPGPTYDVHMPLFAGAGLPEAIAAIEFGCEAEFVRARMPKAAGELVVAGRKARAHVLRQAGYEMRIVLDGAERPLEASLRRGDELLMSIAYDAFETGLPGDPGLFAPPQGVAFAEAPPGR
jgi:hypothetical protein